MKKFVLTIKIAVVLLITSTSFGQVINFPDPNFKAVLLSANESNYIASSASSGTGYCSIDLNNNGEIEVIEAQNINYLNIGYSNISNLSGLHNFLNLVSIGCVGNPITYLDVSALTNLSGLFCSDCQISSINFGSITSISSLFCYNNQLTSLDLSSFLELNELNCSNNLLTNLNVNQCYGFYQLFCSHNLLTNLDISNSCFGQVDCSYNNLQSINLNNSIYNLDCSHNQLTNLNLNGLEDLAILRCDYNNLQTLSFSGIGTNFNLLSCRNNQLSSINFNEIANISEFYGNNNLLTNINVNGLANLSFFECKNNLFTHVDLTNFYRNCTFNFEDNQLTTLLLKNGVYQEIYINNNPNLNYICGDFFELTNLQYSLNQNGNFNCSVSSYCEPTLPYPLSLQGIFKYDNLVNGCDANDLIINDVKLRIDRSSIIQPFYTFNSEPLEAYYPYYYTLTPTFENIGYFNVTPPQASFNFYETGINSFSQDFCVAPNGTHNDLEVVLLPISDAIPGSNTTYKLVFKNKGTHTQSGILSLNIPSNLTTFISSNINPSSQSINQILWGFTDLLPFETREISLTLNLDTAVGTVLNFSTSISSSNADQTPADNIFQLNQTAIASPTANTITCLQGATIQTSQVGNYVHYLIRFKNNSLQDVNSISITTDMLNIDHNTIIPISASHQYTASIKEMLTNNIFEVKFQFIALQVNEEGYIAFKIKTFPNLVTGNNFKNTAKIFFNNNAPIVTNTATTYIGNILSSDNFEKNDAPVFYPNPAQNNITFNQDIKTVLVYTLDGKLLNTQLINNQIDLSGFNPGIYLVRGTTNNGVSFSEKLVKN